MQNVAVIDIGSNSVRLVIYDSLQRVQIPLFNEKILCGLAEGMEIKGLLSKTGVQQAKASFARFMHLCKLMEISHIFSFATSAVRDASDGKEFVNYLQKTHNVKIDVISGQEEAKYASLGAISTLNNANGIIGDLGGGSLELASVKNKEYKNCDSLPLGPLRVNGDKNLSRSELIEYIDYQLSKTFLNQIPPEQNFYPIGGAFRTLAKIHMDKKKYPLKVIHNYKASASSFVNTLEVISRMQALEFKKVEGVSSIKRAKHLPYAALISSRIINYAKIKNVIFCAYGVREGILYDKLQKNIKKSDPLICESIKISQRGTQSENYAQTLYQWLLPLFRNIKPEHERLVLAVCYLSDISCFENAGYRGELAYKRVLDSSLVGISHKQRMFMAVALYQRYNYSLKNLNLKKMKSLINEKSLERAQKLGLIIRLARSLSSSCEHVLDKTTINIKSKKLILKIDRQYSNLVGEAQEKRLRQLANFLHVEFEVKTSA